MRISAFCIIFLFLISQVSQAQEIIPTKGKEFWFGYMQNFQEGVGNEGELNVFIASTVDTEGVLEIPAQGYSQPFTANANEVTTLNIPFLMAEHISNEVVDNKGVHILAEDTIAVFAINFANFTSDASKILPIQSIGTEYRIMSYMGLNSYGSEFLIVATEDDTEIEITPTSPTMNGNPAGVPFTIQLNAGETYQVKSTSQSIDFTGTTIVGTEESGECRPFAVFSGTICANIPVGCTACDHIFDQNFPVNTWGQDFFMVPIAISSGYTYRVLADEDNTNVTINGGAVVVLDAGEFHEINHADEPQCISADKPVCVAQFMQGTTCSVSGDPAMCIMNDATQQIDNITFSTVESTVITDHFVNIVVNSTQVGSVLMDDVPVDPAEFNAFPDCPDRSYAQIPLPEGIYNLKAPGGLSAYIYGLGNAESYSYSAGSFSSDPVEIENVTCDNDTITLTATGGLLNIYWYNETNPEDTLGYGQQYTIYPPIISGIYVAVGSNFQSGCTSEELFSVESPDPMGVSLTQSATEICQYDNVEITVDTDPYSSAYTYSWTPTAGLDDPNSPTPIATPMETTTYTVLVSTPTGCGSNVDSLTITVVDGNVGPFEAMAEPSDICSGDSLLLSTDLQQIILDDNFNDGIDNDLWDEIQNGTADDGCGSMGENALWFNGAGQRSATTIPLDLSDGGTINFGLKIGNAGFPCQDANPGEDVVVEYSLTGMGGPWTIIETYNEALFINFTAVELDVPPPAQTAATSIRWRQLSNSGNNQDNWSIDNVFIESNDVSGLDFNWSPDYNVGDVSALSSWATPTMDTTYYLLVTDPQTGCEYEKYVSVNVDPSFELDMLEDTAVCTLTDIPLFATPTEPGDYEWEWTGPNLDNPNSENPIASPTETATYTVTVISPGFCSAEGEVTVIVNELLSLDIIASEDAVCYGETIDLSTDFDGSTDNIVYSWTPTDGLDDPNIENPVATITSDITYTLILTDTMSECTIQEEIDLGVFGNFNVDAGDDEDLCVVEGFVLDATADSPDDLVWEWSNPGVLSNVNTPNPTITTNESVELVVTATDELGCSHSDTILVNLLYEELDLGPDLETCENEPVTISSGMPPALTFEWSNNAVTPDITVNESGIYTLNVTSPEGCEYSDEVEVTVYAIPVVDLGEEPLLCDGDEYTLDAANPDNDVEWSTGDNTQTITLDESGTYSVVVTNDFGCNMSDSINLVFHAPPVIDLVPVDTICNTGQITYNAGDDGVQFNWSTGANTQSITVNQPGVYSVVVTSAEGCVNEAETVLDVISEPVFDLGPDRDLCKGESAQLTAPVSGVSYLWSTGHTSSNISVSSTNNYSLTVFNSHCSYTDSLTVVFEEPARNNLPEETEFCFEECPDGFDLDAGNPGYTYEWDNGESNQDRRIDQPGLYTVTVTSPAAACERNFTSSVVDLCGYKLYVPNAFTPNEDGVNDLFGAVGGETVEEFELRIFDRWGELIFSSTNQDEKWNGNAGGIHYSQTEVYSYWLKYRYYGGCFVNTPEWVEKTGHVTVIR